MRVLFLGGYRPLVRALQMGLEDEGFTVDVVPDGAAGVGRLTTDGYDAVVLDLPGSRDAAAFVLRSWRKLGLRAPTLVLAGEARTPGVNSAGADWLVKPFELDEFVGRLRALGRAAERRLKAVHDRPRASGRRTAVPARPA
jgi:DNA-binding response OmpR family regulator